ncbi:hypothetical protein C8T65DRAFT_280257 [Cerioporus squamosus]|nr:hypothetical protein C8T65DRAFT_280257 [Cerioporus squamosus]
MTTPRIPLELQELVIDLLDDWNPGIVTVPETLWSCTLTCRAWLPRSRRRLYHSLDFNNIPRTVLNQLVELIDREQEVSSMVQNLRIGERPDEEGDEDDDEEKAKDQRAEEVEDEENDDKGEYDEEDRNDGDHWYLMEQQDQRETRPVKDIIRTGAVLLILARKLPRLASLMISGAVMASPARLPVLAGFPALATLELSHVTISGYGAFQRMLAAAPGLRRLCVSWVIWTSRHISPTIQYFRLRCPPLTHLMWFPDIHRPASRETSLSWHTSSGTCTSVDRSSTFSCQILISLLSSPVSFLTDFPTCSSSAISLN